MTNFDKDIVVSGGGLAGMIAAIAFARAGFDTLCVDPAAPVIDMTSKDVDLRTTAFLQPAQAILAELGIWTRFTDFAMPLETMRIIDAGGPEIPAKPRVVKDFKSTELSELPFGWNIPNLLARRELLAIISDLPNLEFRTGVSCTRLFTRESEARVTLSDKSRIRTKLVVAADGRNSPMRDQAWINVNTTRFGQKALAFAVTHPIRHENVSTEIHQSGGPFTLVPLPDLRGIPSSAVVWMETGPNAAKLAHMSVEDFEQAMTERSCNILGPLKLISPRSVWPIIAQIADRLTGQRIALVAEAAHVVPPIGAQGLNMSLNDIQALRDLAIEHRDTLGSPAMLDQYHNDRYPDIRTRVQGIALLNRTSMFSAQPMRDLRAAGINALYALPQVRKLLMQMGLGAK